MSYNNTRNYNTRNSGRYNRPGSFVPASSTGHQTYEVPLQPLAQNPEPPQQPLAPPPPPPAMKGDSLIKQEDVEMTAAAAADASASNGVRQPFFKTKLAGVKKISNKERRRRQNALLRRLTSPKNALMCINEMLPNEQIANQFKVEAASQDSVYYSHGSHNFCAELTLDGVIYKGYGENKLSARNAAAEQAIRDIVLKKMERYSEVATHSAVAAAAAAAAGPGPGDSNDGSEAGEEEGEALPMIQLLSFALHKLFAEWEGAGHHVPQLRANRPPQSVCEEEMAAAPPPRAAPRPAASKKPRKVPENAADMHPAMLLTILRPQAAYRELSAEGDKPQNMVFTMAVDVDDKTYLGKASSKKEARKAAARAACKGILGITFHDELGAGTTEH